MSDERLLIRAEQAAHMLDMGRSTFWAHVKSGDLPQPIKIGGLTRWRLAEIRQFMGRSAPEPVKPQPEPAPMEQMPPSVPLGPGAHHLYRHYDADGTLLYIGISLNAISRLLAHKDYASWFAGIARIEITGYPDRATAALAERIAIGRENPKHNIHFLRLVA
jgi:predicted DNA-binding transcriptional regulator AlpA